MSSIKQYLNIGSSIEQNGFEYFLHHSDYTYNELLGILDYLLHLKDNSKEKKVYREYIQSYLCQATFQDIKIGVLSDTHIGDKGARWEMISGAYEEFAHQNITHVLHLGDMMNGKYGNYYKKQYSIEKCYDQINQIERLYPKDFLTYILFGNHEYSFLQFGIDPVKEIQSRNPHLQVLGYRSAYVKWRSKILYLKHDIHKNLFCAPYHYKNDLVLRGHSHTFSYDSYKRILNVPTCSKNYPNGTGDSGFLILRMKHDHIYMNYYEFVKHPKLVLSRKL